MIARHYWKVGGASSVVNSCSRSSKAEGPSGLSILPASTPSPSSRPEPAWPWGDEKLRLLLVSTLPGIVARIGGEIPVPRSSGSLAPGWCLLGLLREQLGYQLRELAPSLNGDEFAVLINEEHGRNRVDAPRSGEVALPAFALVVLGPPDFLLLDKLLEGVEPSQFLGLIEADAKELHALAVKLF